MALYNQNMEYIEALGFSDARNYKRSWLNKFEGKRVFVHPANNVKITFNKNMDLEYYYKPKDAKFINDINIRLAFIILGPHANYIEAVADLITEIATSVTSKKITIKCTERFMNKEYNIIFNIYADADRPVYTNQIDKLLGGRDDGIKPDKIIRYLKDEHIMFFVARRMRRLQEKCKYLKQENAELKEKIKFMPGGPGFNDAKQHFDDLVKN